MVHKGEEEPRIYIKKSFISFIYLSIYLIAEVLHMFKCFQYHGITELIKRLLVIFQNIRTKGILPTPPTTLFHDINKQEGKC